MNVQEVHMKFMWHCCTPYYICVAFFYRMEKWLNYALHGNIKIGADVTPFRMPSEADFVYL